MADCGTPETNFKNPRVFLGELRQLGYAEGKNLVIGWYFAAGYVERYPEVVLEVVRRNLI